MTQDKKPHLVTARFSEETLKKIERESEREERTRSEVVRRLVEKALRCKDKSS